MLTKVCSTLWEGPAVLVHVVQSLTADQPGLLQVQPLELLEGPGACHRLACTVGVVLCFCGP